jgi:hypothetical protein
MRPDVTARSFANADATAANAVGTTSVDDGLRAGARFDFDFAGVFFTG